MADINGVIFFCDDVREERSGKMSYIGAYGPVIFVDQVPSLIQRMTAVFLGRIRGIERVSVKIRATLEGAPEAEMSLSEEKVFERPKEELGEDWILRINVVGPLPAAENAKYKVWCQVEDFTASSELLILPTTRAPANVEVQP